MWQLQRPTSVPLDCARLSCARRAARSRSTSSSSKRQDQALPPSGDPLYRSWHPLVGWTLSEVRRMDNLPGLASRSERVALLPNRTAGASPPQDPVPCPGSLRQPKWTLTPMINLADGAPDGLQILASEGSNDGTRNGDE